MVTLHTPFPVPMPLPLLALALPTTTSSLSAPAFTWTRSSTGPGPTEGLKAAILGLAWPASAYYTSCAAHWHRRHAYWGCPWGWSLMGGTRMVMKGGQGDYLAWAA